MYCDYCGTELDGNRCGNCGATTQLNSKRIVSQVDLGPQIFECKCSTIYESAQYTKENDWYYVGGILRAKKRMDMWHLYDGCPTCGCWTYKLIISP